MNAIVLLCVTVAAADPVPAPVRAMVLAGTAKGATKADVDTWVARAIAVAGSPSTQPSTEWISLTDEEKELYASMRGGRLIKGRASAKDDGFEVEISGFKIKPLKQSLALTPGQRRVVKLTDYPPPGNVFLALEAPRSKRAAERIESLKAGVKDFRLELTYHGDEDKPYYRLALSVSPVEGKPSNAFLRGVQVDQVQAKRIIDHLASDGFLDRAQDAKTLPAPGAGPTYRLSVRGGDFPLAENLGWDLNMLKRLDGLRSALDGDAAQTMDLLLGRMSGHRRAWEANVPNP